MPTTVARRRRALTNNPGFITARKNVERAVATVRRHFDMDVAFVSEFVGDMRILQYVDSKDAGAPIAEGQTIPMSEGFCRKIVEGELPGLIANTADLPSALAIRETHSIPIGSHLSVPLRLSDGHVYGTFCCFSYQAQGHLSERDLSMMKVFAELIAHQIDTDVGGIRDRVQIFDRIDAVLKSDQPSMVYQPSFSLSTSELLGAESLARFGGDSLRAPDVWFKEAGRVNLQVDLELKAIRHAIAGFAKAWRSGSYHLGLNSSPATILDKRLLGVLEDAPPDCIVLEITEHDHVEDYTTLKRALQPLRDRGIKIAVDDAGSGYASMRHVLNIRPDIIKLDVSLTNGIDTDLTRLALARALCEFGHQTGCSLVAEGIETAAQLETLRGIGVHAAQGYFLGRPKPIEDFCRLIKPAKRRA